MLSSCRLYSWMRLICTSNSASGSRLMPVRSETSARQRYLVGAAARAEALAQRRVVGQRAPAPTAPPDRRAPAVPTASTSSDGERRIGLEQPAPERDAVGLVDDPVRDASACRSRNTVLRMRSVCSADTPLTRCEPRNARWPMRTRRPPFSSISDTEASKSPSSRPAARSASRCSRVDPVDDLHVPRQQPLQQVAPARSPAPRAAACDWCS